MSAVGTIKGVDRASWGDNDAPCWRVWVALDDPRSLPDAGPDRPAHEWAFDLKREADSTTPPVAYGERVTVSTHGRNSVLIDRPTGAVMLKSLEGMYDPATRL